ncbi:hypothetical protein M4D79_01610 [Mycolicibacterium novocastrense]|nr:hypothetical protein M4D79_01610 [Mycolicibacterium novocastrense]
MQITTLACGWARSEALEGEEATAMITFFRDMSPDHGVAVMGTNYRPGCAASSWIAVFPEACRDLGR